MKIGKTFKWWGTNWKCREIKPDSFGRMWVIATNGKDKAHILLSQLEKEKPKQGELM